LTDGGSTRDADRQSALVDCARSAARRFNVSSTIDVEKQVPAPCF
jgi:hypothetical protein